MAKIKAPAKLNLYLDVTGKRTDGYHLLDTLIVFTDICDEVEIIPADEFSFEVTGEFAGLAGNNEHNLVIRAMKLMQQESGKHGNFAINLTKNIPVGAGLGGGSADTAATILILNDLLEAGFSKEKLAAIGLKLGADVPVFIHGHAAFVSGIGEEIAPAHNLPEMFAVLIYPNKPLVTKDVFGAYRTRAGVTEGNPGNSNTSLRAEGVAIQESNIQELLDCHVAYAPRNDVLRRGVNLPYLTNQKNDLETLAIKLLPEISAILKELSALDGCQFSRMSGSGSTCFSIFTERHKAAQATSLLKQQHPEFWIEFATIMDSAFI